MAYLGRVMRRMERVGFLYHDPLCVMTKGAYDSRFSLRIELHYRSCNSGVGRPTTMNQESGNGV